MKKIVIISAVVLGALTANAQKINLKLAKDAKLNYTIAIKSNTNTEAMGQSMESTANITTDVSYLIGNVGASEVDVVSTLLRMKMTTSAMGQENSYDSEKDKDGEMAESLGDQIGKANALKIDMNGKIIPAVGGKKTKEDEEKEAMKGAMSQMMGGASATEIEFVNAGVLNQELKEGATFTYANEDKSDKGSDKKTYEFKVVSVKGNMATISYTGKSTNATTMSMMGMEMAVVGDDKFVGTLVINIDNGTVVSDEKTTTVNKTIEAGGMTMPTTGTVVKKTMLKN